MSTPMKIASLASALVAASLLGSCAATVVPEDAEPGAVAPVSEELRKLHCRADSDCPAPGAPCQLCSDGSAACPDVECIHRHCVYSFPQCPPPVDACANVRCAAGTHCEAGACVPDAPKVFCGGIAGIPCPGAGTCIDDPSDDCDPQMGGADCGGICVCNALGLCVAPAQWNSSPEVCGCAGDGS